MSHSVCEAVIMQMEMAVREEFEKCIECGACYIDCPFDLWGDTDQEKRQTVKDANDFVFSRKPVPHFLKSEIFRCAECDKCFRPCPAGIHRKNANLLVKLKIQPGNVDKLKSHPARLRGVKQYLFEHMKVSQWSDEERAWYDSLNENRRADTLVYHGCYVASTKDDCIKLDSMFKHCNLDFVTYGKFEYCCGNFGLYRGVSDLCETSPHIRQMIEAASPSEIITNCGHCSVAVKDVLAAMGKSDDIRVLHPSEKLLELVIQKKLVLKKQDRSVTIQDSCLNDMNSGGSAVRSLLERVVDISECMNSKQMSLCCGDVAHIADPEGIAEYNAERIRGFNETAADNLAVYCAGCKDIYSSYDELKTVDMVELVYDSFITGG